MSQTPLTSEPFAVLGRRRGMSQSDRVLVGVGAVVAAVAVLSVLILFPVLGGASAAAAALVMLIGLGGAGLMAFGLRQQLPVALGIAGGVAVLLLLGLVVSTRTTGDKSVSTANPPSAGTAETSPPSQTPAATQPAVSSPTSVAPTPTTVPAADSSSTASTSAARPDSGSPPSSSEASPFVALPSSPPSPSPSSSPMPPATPEPPRLQVPQSTKSELIGGRQDGAGFEIRRTGTPITSVMYRMGSWANEPGFTDIVPTSSGSSRFSPHPRHRPPGRPGLQSTQTVTAKDGYAVGGIQTDSGSNFLHAVQIVFMRVRPDGRLDPNDSYTSDWIGQPQGPVQKVASSGAPVVGFHGRRMALVHSIGLVYASEESGLASTSPSPFVPAQPSPSTSPFVPAQPSPSPSSSPPSSVPSLPAAMSATTSPAPPNGKEPQLAALPAVVTDALESTVLVEHTLASGSGFAIANNVVATNAHVVEGAFADEIKIKFGKENNAARRISRVLHFDRSRDLCLLEGELDMKPLPVRPDYELKAGDSAVLMGNPSVRGGILMRNVTNRGTLRTLVHIDGQDLYHIDADVNPGWSGGPVLDMEGRVIAVVVMKANDTAVAELRDAMRKLDDGFRAANTSSQGGITYGIPASALAKLMQDGVLTDLDRQAESNDRYMAQTVVGRMTALAGLAMLNIQANVPVQVRMEANAFAKGGMPVRPSRFSTVKIEYVPLPPEEVCRALAAFLRSRKVRELEDHFRKNLDTRLESVDESPYVDDEVKRGLKTLAKKIKDAVAYADRPGTTYAAYSIKVNGFSRDLKELINRLDKAVDASE